MDVKRFDSELKVMAVLWSDGDVPASISLNCLLSSWDGINTTYLMRFGKYQLCG